MHVTVNFLGLFFRTGKIFFGLTRFSCPSVRMTDNFSASFGKSGLKSRRVIKCPLLADRHRRTRLAWRLARRGWNLWTWRKIHWSDESRFLLHATNGRMSVWRHKNTAYTPRNIQPTAPYGGGSVMVWGCISHDCKLDLITIQGNLTGDQYIRDILQPVIPHFDNHPLAIRPLYMDDNAMPHRSRAATAYLQSEAVTSVPWAAMSPDLNPIEHIWDMLGRRIQAREPPVQNIRQLEAALHREWQQFSQQDIRRLTEGMRRRVEAVIQAPGTELWTIDVIKWFISDVLKVKWQSYRAFWTVKVNT